MQNCESYNQKNSLFNAMNRFIGAVNNMDQTVMVPSLLRDVPLDEDGVKTQTANGAAYFHQDGDMYSSYVLLKSIRTDMEWGVVQGDERRRDKAGVGTVGVVTAGAAALEDEDDLEKQFHFHLKGLHTVLSKLTRQADMLTTRYKEEIRRRH